MIDVSVVILFSDKDRQNAVALFKRLTHLNKQYIQILLVDNGTSPSGQKEAIRFDHIPVMQVRRDILPYCKGKYVWYIDGDDSIVNTGIFDIIHQTKNIDWDCLAVSYIIKSTKTKASLMNDDMLLAYCTGLWGRIIKKSLLEQIYYNICFPYQTFEDTVVILYLAYIKAKIFKFVKYPVYEYRQYLSPGINDQGYYLRDLGNVVDHIRLSLLIDANTKSFLLSRIFELLMAQLNRVQNSQYFNFASFMSKYYILALPYLEKEIIEYYDDPFSAQGKLKMNHIKLKTIS